MKSSVVDRLRSALAVVFFAVAVAGLLLPLLAGERGLVISVSLVAAGLAGIPAVVLVKAPGEDPYVARRAGARRARAWLGLLARLGALEGAALVVWTLLGGGSWAWAGLTWAAAVAAAVLKAVVRACWPIPGIDYV